MAIKKIDKGYVLFYRGPQSYIEDLYSGSTTLNPYGLYFATDTGKIYFLKNQTEDGGGEVAIISSENNTNTLFSRGTGTDSVFLISTDKTYENNATGRLGFTIGGKNTASGILSFASGYGTTASGFGAQTLGEGTTAAGNYSFSGGGKSYTYGDHSFAFGENIVTRDAYEFAVGKFNKSGNGVEDDDPKNAIAFSVGCGTDKDNRANAFEVRANGDIFLKGMTKTLSELLFSETGPIQSGSGKGSAVLVVGTNYASGEGSVSIGTGSTASGDYSHAEGNASVASGETSHSEGSETEAKGYASHAEGFRTDAYGEGSHTEGYYSSTGETGTSKGQYSHAEGEESKAIGNTSHAEGKETESNGTSSHSEGNASKSTGYYSHSEGESTESKGASSHAEGYQTVAENDYEHASGRYNESHKYSDTATYWMNTIASIGCGTEDQRENAIEVKANGDVYYKSTLLDFIFSKLVSKTASIANINKCTYSIRKSDGSYTEVDGLTPEDIHTSSPAEIFGIPCDVTSLEYMVTNKGTDAYLTKVWGDYWYTGNITSMRGTFAACKALTSVGDISDWNVENVTTFEKMFYDSPNVTRVGDIGKWNPKSCKTTNSMFAKTNFLGHVDFSGWWESGSDSNCTDMESMFDGCSNMDYIGIPTIKADSNVSNMFRGCTGLKNITSCGIISAPGSDSGYIDFGDCKLTKESAMKIFEKLDITHTGTIVLSTDTISKFGTIEIIKGVVSETNWNVSDEMNPTPITLTNMSGVFGAGNTITFTPEYPEGITPEDCVGKNCVISLTVIEGSDTKHATGRLTCGTTTSTEFPLIIPSDAADEDWYKLFEETVSNSYSYTLIVTSVR